MGIRWFRPSDAPFKRSGSDRAVGAGRRIDPAQGKLEALMAACEAC